jgi:hypothetical protein
MSDEKAVITVHPEGELQKVGIEPCETAVSLDTFAGKIQVKWAPDAEVTGAANGKVETSRGRKSPAQVYMGALRECRRKRYIRVKREPLEPLYRKEKRAFGV